MAKQPPTQLEQAVAIAKQLTETISLARGVQKDLERERRELIAQIKELQAGRDRMLADAAEGIMQDLEPIVRERVDEQLSNFQVAVNRHLNNTADKINAEFSRLSDPMMAALHEVSLAVSRAEKTARSKGLI